MVILGYVEFAKPNSQNEGNMLQLALHDGNLLITFVILYEKNVSHSYCEY